MIIATFSGVRFLTETTPPLVAHQYTSAFARYLRVKNIKHIIIGSDGRSSANIYLPFVISSLKDFSVEYVGVVPTPTIQQLVQLSEVACAGIICTASHNNEDWCGLKFVDSDSIFLNPTNCQTVYGDLQSENVDSQDIQNASEFVQNTGNRYNCIFTSNTIAIQRHINAILASNKINKDIIRAANLKISFNGMCASGSAYIEQLCQQFNIILVEPFNMKLGKLPQFPEPTLQNLKEFESHCASLDIDCAFAVDPDADRCVLIAGGKVISEELTLASAVTGYLSLNSSPYVVKNVSTSLATDAAAAKFNTKVLQTAVGEVNVCMKMKEVGAKIGGEGNGGVIMADAHYGRDSIVAILLILQWISIEKKTLAELIHGLESFAILKLKFDYQIENRGCIETKLTEFSKLQEAKGLKIVLVDGVKIENLGSWVQVRFSNTEPIVRIFAEAEDLATAEKLAKEVQEFLGW
ncbi:Phosphoglucosamine mutase [Spironucleus salmonicida]|uniref:Phosphoacetylglucosamine mutase n=1 Tax=Spironucleus salmonicida TaxID=348837 RepID=V6LK31_9EUKA|nr:Phosphoglucosamine mutase [Spironucleus salmonicida]|eukprot:EST44980.1 Phosphoacetylglucosamine mutase [Spironucleus salmonicida]